jgi:predicted Zn-dependent protease
MPVKRLSGLTHVMVCALSLSFTFTPSWAQPSAAPSIGSLSSTELSPALERKLGEAIMLQGRRDPDFINDPDLSQYLENMGRKLGAYAPGGAPQIEVFGVRSSEINAFAMPGGFIGVHTGLIVGSGSESEVAGVVAHEIAHVTQRHIARGLTQQRQSGHIALASIAAALLAALMPGGGQAAMGIAAFGQAAAIDRQLGFSREAEQEADRNGVEMLRKAGYDPSGMAAMFGRLSKASSLNEGRGGGAYVSTHPLSLQRMSDMQNRVRQFGPARPQIEDEYWFIRAKSRVVQAVDPRALRQAQEQLEDEARASASREGAAPTAARRAAAWYGVSLAALARQDSATAASALAQAQPLMPHSPYIELQRIDIELARKQVASALKMAQAAHKRWPQRRSFALRTAQSLQLLGRDTEAVAFLNIQIKRWPQQEPELYKMLAISQDRIGEPVQARQTMAIYYEHLGALPSAFTQLQQARTMSKDFYVQSQIDVKMRELSSRIAEDRRLLERFRS